MRRDIRALDQDARSVLDQIAIEARVLDQAGHRRWIAGIDPALNHVPGDSAIHRARVYVNKTKPLRELLRDAALTRSSRAIDRDDAMVGGGHATPRRPSRG